MIQAQHACRASTACSIASSPAAAASAPASIRRSIAATARAISPTTCARTAAAPPRRSSVGETELLTVHQIHSTDVLTVADQRWTSPGAPKADALVTDRPGVVLGVLAADCAPVLLADPARRRDRRRPCRLEGRAGRRRRGRRSPPWKGSARSASACARAIGPCIGRDVLRGRARNSPRRSSRRTRPTRPSSSQPPRAGHFLFDLAGYLARRIALRRRRGERHRPRHAGRHSDDFFSYRRNTLRGRARLWPGPVGDRARGADVPYLIILMFCCLLGLIATCAML